jgi:hypothetical protein
VFGRRTSPEADPVTPPPAHGATVATGKGRPTPTRAQAQAARKLRSAPPRNRKEAAAKRKEAVRASRGQMRSAMATGDERYLPARDQGPVRRYVRDYIDSHRTMGEYLLPVFFVLFILVYVSASLAAAVGSFAWLAVMALLAIDSVRVMRGLKAGIRSRFGDAATKGITMYALTRAWQMRRLRLPKPMMKPGQPLDP